MNQIIALGLALFAVIEGANYSTKYSEKLAEGFKLSRYVVGFIVVSFISILPETFIAINAAIQGQASFGLGTILGSNVADLTLIFAIIVFASPPAGLKIEKSMANKLLAYPLFLSIPLLLGLDGYYSRTEGLSLIVIGVIFYIYVFKKAVGMSSRIDMSEERIKNLLILIGSLILLLVGAHFTVETATSLAKSLNISPVLIGILIVGLGTTIPELSFSLKAVRDKKPALAVGDLMGSVLADATIVIGLIATIQPFEFPAKISYIAGGWMVASSILLVISMKTNYRIKKPEAIILIFVWLLYIVAELLFQA